MSNVKVVPFNIFEHGAIIVPDDEAVKIPTKALPSRDVICLYNMSNKTIYIGNSEVTKDNGFPIHSKSSITLEISAQSKIYAICENGTAEVRYLEGA